MLTAWAKKCTGYANTPISPATNTVALIQAKRPDGTIKYITTTPSANLVFNLQTNYNNPGVVFGSDGTAESENDYAIGSILTGISATTPSLVQFADTDNNKYGARVDFAISNNNAESITIREIGFLRKFATANNKGDNANSSTSTQLIFLFDRTVLQTPITIPAGEARTVRYQFEYSV